MGAYILRRLLLMIPTLFGILAINFLIIQLAPGGPISRLLAEEQGMLQGGGLGGGGDFSAQGATEGAYQGSRGVPTENIRALEEKWGLNKPPLEQFGIMVWNYARLDFGDSFFKREDVSGLIWSRLPVSVSLGLWTTLLAYMISIPLGISKAVRDGAQFDVWTSGAIIVGYAIPGFLFGVLLRLYFSGGEFLKIFPLAGLESLEWARVPWTEKILHLAWWGDYLWHMVLPVTALTIGAFATLTLLTKNCFLDEIRKQYVLTARAKGLSENRVLYGHVFRNAMLIVVAGFPAAFVSIFFTGSLLIEVVFSLDGLGLLAYEAADKRDYPIILGTLFLYSIIGVVMHLITDVVYTLIDPRIDFDRREA